MAEFITTIRASYLIEKIIDEAQEFIILITPYIKIHESLRRKIEQKLSTSSLKIIFVCRNIENSPALSQTRGKENLKIFTNANLHAKCYLNENEAIITSLNLYDYSMVHNVEYGVHFTRKEDIENYNKALLESKNLLPKDYKIVEHKGDIIEFDELVDLHQATDFELAKADDGFEYLNVYKGGKIVNRIKVSGDIVLTITGKDRMAELAVHYKIYRLVAYHYDIEYRFGH